MNTLLPREQQIVHVHAAMICEVVKVAQNKDLQKGFEPALQAALNNGWHQLVSVIRRIIAGERGMELLNSLDDEDQVIIEAVLRGLQDPATLPDPTAKQNADMAAPGLATMIHGASRGDVDALQMISEMAVQMNKAGGEMTLLAAVIRPMIDGERELSVLSRGMSETAKKLLDSILEELQKLNAH